MPIFDKKYIDTATYVISFERDEKVRFRQADAEKAFSSIFQGVQSIQTNVPDDFDPNAPRLILQKAKKTLTVSQIAVQYTMNFDAFVSTETDQLKIIEKNIINFCAAMKEFIAEDKIEHQGYIISTNYKSKQKSQERNKYVFERFFRIEPYGEIASTNFKIGFKTQDLLFLNFEASSYEMRETKIEKNVTNIIKVDQMTVIEEGYNAKIDINNRPMFIDNNKPLPYMEAANKIQELMKNTVEHEIDKFMGFE